MADNPIAGNGTGAGIEAHGEQVTVTNSAISGNRYGVVAEGAANISVTDVTISGSSSAGVYIFDSSTANAFSPRVTVESSNINGSGGALGIDADAGGVIVRESTISGHATGIDLSGGEVLVEDSSLTSNGTAVSVSGGLADLGDVRCQGGGNFTSLGTSHGMNSIAGNGAGVTSSALDAVLAQANWWETRAGRPALAPAAATPFPPTSISSPTGPPSTARNSPLLLVSGLAASRLDGARMFAFDGGDSPCALSKDSLPCSSLAFVERWPAPPTGRPGAGRTARAARPRRTCR